MWSYLLYLQEGSGMLSGKECHLCKKGCALPNSGNTCPVNANRKVASPERARKVLALCGYGKGIMKLAALVSAFVKSAPLQS